MAIAVETTQTSPHPVESYPPEVRQLLAPENRELLLSLLEGQPAPCPVYLTVDPTPRCPGRCASCIEKKTVRLGRECALPLQILLDLARDSKAAGVRAWGFYGGEPLAHPDFGQVLLGAVNAGLFVHLVTNGFLAGRRDVRAALVESARSGLLESVRISLNAGTAETHSRHFGIRYPIFEHVLASATELGTLGVPIFMSYLIDQENCQEVELGAERALGEAGCRRLYLRPTTGLHGIGVGELRPDLRASLLSAIRRLQTAWPERVFVPGWYLRYLSAGELPSSAKSFATCAFCSLRAVVTGPPPGAVWSCSYFREHQEFYLGELPFPAWLESRQRREGLRQLDPGRHCAGVVCNKAAANRWLEEQRAEYRESGTLPPTLDCQQPPFFLP